MFATARSEADRVPATYRRRTYFTRSDAASAASKACNDSCLLRDSLLTCHRHPSRRHARPSRWLSIFPWPQIQAHERSLRVRQVADDLLDRLWQLAHQRRQRQDLIAARELRFLQQIDHFDPVFPGQMLLADPFQV